MKTFLPSSNPSCETWLLEHLGMVHQIARRIAQRLPSHIAVEDLIQEGLLGLLKVWSECRIHQGNQAYLTTRVRGSILDALRRQDWISRRGRQLSRKIQQSREQLCQFLGHEPSLSQVAAWNNLSATQLQSIEAESKRAMVLSWEELHEVQGPVEPSSDVPDPRQQQLVEELLQRLPPRERTILRLHYFENRKLGEIAKDLEVSQARLSQLHKQALNRLREEVSPAAQTQKPFARAAFFRESRRAVFSKAPTASRRQRQVAPAERQT